MNVEQTISRKNLGELEESNCNDETGIQSTYNYSYLENNSINTTLNQNSFILPEKINERELNEKNDKKKTIIISENYKNQIEEIVDKQFEEEYKKLNNEYEEKMEELLNEQEKIVNMNEILKAKYFALERYLKNYCRKANIDYECLID